MEIPATPAAFLTEFLPALVRSRDLGDATSVGSITVNVLGEGTWSLRLEGGELEVESAKMDDALVQLSLEAQDFEPLVVEPLRAFELEVQGSAHSGASKIFAQDPQVASAVRHLPGSVLLEIKDGDRRRRVLVTPGVRNADFDTADCVVSCDISDYLAVAGGQEPAMQLFLSGRLTVTGNVQLALALSGLFA